jgi:dihydropyrimidinase
MTFAELTGAHTYIVHLSCKRALDEAIAARGAGSMWPIETLIQYLVLDKTYAERPDFEGAKYVMSPPLRGVENQAALWEGLKDGVIQTVATDHAPFDFAGQKRMGMDDFTKIPNGIPSLEERINLLYTYGVRRRERSTCTPSSTSRAPRPRSCSTSTRARAASSPGRRGPRGVRPRLPGRPLGPKTQHINVDYNAFEGWKIEGRPSVVTVRGKVAARDGAFVGDPTRGRFLKRTPEPRLARARSSISPPLEWRLEFGTAAVDGRRPGCSCRLRRGRS